MPLSDGSVQEKRSRTFRRAGAFGGISGHHFQKKPEQVQISIKTRLGISSAGEFPQILRIYEKYPLAELIIHPRVREDFYGNHPDLEAFEEAFMQCSFPVCYNGDLFSAGDLEQFIKTHEKVKRIMLGRGLLANPGFW